MGQDFDFFPVDNKGIIPGFNLTVESAINRVVFPPRTIGVAWLKDMPLSAAAIKLIDILDYQVTSDI